jgi:MFS family permease
MFAQIKKAWKGYPRQFWLMFFGMLISTIGSSMIWPFLMIYVNAKLKLPLTTIASLMTISAIMGLISSLIGGPIVDRFGRKWVMAISLFLNALGYLYLSQANSFPIFALLIGLNGAANPLYRVGADAMMADLIPAEKRIDAYSMMRLSNNLGVALGPTIGGFVAAVSYSIAFYLATVGLALYGILVSFFAIETMPQTRISALDTSRERFAGYGQISRDRPFISFTVNFTLIQVCAAMIWVLLGVYSKQNYLIPESLYGFIPTTNALMVVFIQLSITRFTKKYPPLSMLALGSFFYAIGVGSVALGTGFWGFWLSMVILTIGELILSPTSSAYAANLAPADKRGRYMSLYGLTWGVASGIGPVLGSLLNDNIGPKSIWYGGGIVGLASMCGFLVLTRLFPQNVEIKKETEKIGIEL